jgi:hypothetical protein
LTETKPLIASFREAHDAAQTRSMLMDSPIEKDISGREFMQRLENEKEQPILCFET